jgi:hypothetical protein
MNGGTTNMMVVGQVSTSEEAQEIELITKIYIVAYRARILAHEAKEAYKSEENRMKSERMSKASKVNK